VIYLSNGPTGKEVQLLAIFGEHALGSVEASKIGGTIDDDALDRDEETTIKSNWAITLEDLGDAIKQTIEFTIASPKNHLVTVRILSLN
jgi:hypothetical protein